MKSVLAFALLGATALATAQQKYDSAFAGYRAWQEPATADWKETNKKIAQAPGMGHDAHAGHDMSQMGTSEDKAAAPKPAVQAAPKPDAKADPHHGHHQMDGHKK